MGGKLEHHKKLTLLHSNDLSVMKTGRHDIYNWQQTMLRQKTRLSMAKRPTLVDADVMPSRAALW